jgi:hypothetical protein
VRSNVDVCEEDTSRNHTIHNELPPEESVDEAFAHPSTIMTKKVTYGISKLRSDMYL